MEMYRKFLFMVTMTTVSLLLIFSHLDWRRDQYEIVPSKSPLVMGSLDNIYHENREGKENESKSLKFDSSPKESEAKNHETSLKFEGQPEKTPGKDKPVKKVPEVKLKTTTQPYVWGDYPAWFTKGWSRTATAGQMEVFVGDRPLFPACSSSSDNSKYKFIEPRRYLTNCKNPCWFEDPMKTKTFRCLPYFYLAGVARCGTTDLFRRLRMHPDIMKGTMKESHYWDRERFGTVVVFHNGDTIAEHRKPWSLKQYTDAVTGDRDLSRVKDDIKYKGNSSKIFGDGSPSYLWDIHNWKLLDGNQGCKEPRYVIGQHMKHVTPSAKIILIFRHPTPRLYSRFLSRIWRTKFLNDATSQTFHDYVVKGVRMYRECFKRWSIRHCAYNVTLYENAVIRLVEGMYPVFMGDWLRIWPRDQMLLLRSEDYAKNVTEVLDKTFHFLGVDSLTGDVRVKVMTHDPIYMGAENGKLGPMRPETVKILDEFYQPFVQQFAQMLHDPRFLWRDVYPTAADRFRSSSAFSLAQPTVGPSVLPGNGQTTRPGATHTGKPLPLWAKLLFQIRPGPLSSSGSNDRQNEEQPVMRIEKPPSAPIKKAQYPPWWVSGWPKSATSGLGDQFLGDQPFFAPCISRSRTGKAYNLLEPRIYTDTTQNPCWFKEPQVQSSLRCLPYFYIAGVAKSGASDLYRRLRVHPDVMKGSLKEYHWWDRGRFGDFYSDDLPIKAEKPEGIRVPFKQYTDMVSGKQGISTILEDLNATGHSTRIFGDTSPSYFNDVKLWPLLDGNQGCSEPRVTIAQHIHHMTPNAKIIIVVRHPTPRSYLRFLARVPEKVSLRKEASFAFHRLVKKSVNMYRACFDRWSVRHCAYNTTLYDKDKVKLWEGMYSVFLWDWLRVFPRHQIRVFRYRDLIRETRQVMTNLFHFLDLPPLNETAMRGLTAEKWLERRGDHELKKYFGAMLPETTDMLNDFYEPFVDKFAETLNDERFLWRDSDHL